MTADRFRSDRFGPACHRLDNRVGELGGAGGAADIAGALGPVAVNLLNRVADAPGGVVLAEVAKSGN